MRIGVKISVNHGFWVPKGFGVMDFDCSNKAFWCAWVYGRSRAWSRQSNSKKRARSTGSLCLSLLFFLSFFLFFQKMRMLWKLCFTTTEKLLAWCGFWGFWHLGGSNHPAMAPLFTVDLKRVYISRQLHMILEVVHVHPFPTLPQQSCSWGFSDVEMSWVVLLTSCTIVKFCIFFSILWLWMSSISV